MSNRSQRSLRALRVVCCTAVIVSLTTVDRQVDASEECISKQARDALAFCPGGKFKASLSKRPQVSFSSAPEELKLKKRGDMTKPVNPNKIAKAAQRDERRVRMKARARKLLTTEIQNVERLYKSTPKKSSDRPQLMRRLAEGYVELESASFREKVEAEVKYQALKKKDPTKAKRWLSEAKKASAVLKLARTQAIKYYGRLKKQYPKWC
ncbi:MAG: hypothetical protein JRI23_18490, partial [Deltaproteobacteria bacterium]|nr:hypothetical protein [Deltaproteobacteria bacterium]MBW2533849.1 hypothetical protein [Deltaproteobacteria bacterium]